MRFTFSFLFYKSTGTPPQKHYIIMDKTYTFFCKTVKNPVISNDFLKKDYFLLN